MIHAEFFDHLSRFWAKVERGGPDDCWAWTGETNNKGYGRVEFWHHGTRTRIQAHRLALRLAGCTVAPDAKVLHSCDNPPCVNPAHLSVGTQLVNIRDALAKGRMNLSGLVAEIEHTCRTCGCPFIGPPNRRYCDEHRVRSVRRHRARSVSCREATTAGAVA